MPFYVYKFLDENNKIIYIGKTSDIDKRIKSHRVLLTDFDYDFGTYNFHTVITHENLREVFNVLFAKVLNGYYASIYEANYISKYLPIYNNDLKYYSNTHIDLPDLDWFEYTIDYSKSLTYYYTKKIITKLELIELSKEKDCIRKSIIIDKLEKL